METAGSPDDLARGLVQLRRYLATCWDRSRITSSDREDCDQSVVAIMVEQFGAEGFRRLMEAVGRTSIRRVFSREKPEGLVFLRAVWCVRKRANRTRNHALLSGDERSPADDSLARSLDLVDLIRARLSVRQADLVEATLRGDAPADIAVRWGVTAKTVSNEKSRAFECLRRSPEMAT